MIIRPKPTLLNLFFILRGSIIQTIAPKILLIAVVGEIVATINHFYPGIFKSISIAPFAILGLSLSIFFGYRNNACSERWWEARKLLGHLVYEMRSFAREITALLSVEEEVVKQRIIRRAIAFTHALMARLRSTDAQATVRNWVPSGDWPHLASRRNMPNAILQDLAGDLADCMRRDQISDILYSIFETRLTAFSETQAGCERILSTPVPFAYSLLLHRTATAFCLLLPCALVESYAWLTPLPAMAVAYTFFGLDALGDELEEPFGLTPHDLPLNAIARIIEIDLLEALGEKNLPEPLKPVDFVLQ